MTDETPDRTTLNVVGTMHREAREVKGRHGESWTDVLRFYVEHRGDVSVCNGDGERVSGTDVHPAVADQLAELSAHVETLQDLVDSAPERTADELEGRFR